MWYCQEQGTVLISKCSGITERKDMFLFLGPEVIIQKKKKNTTKFIVDIAGYIVVLVKKDLIVLREARV